VPTENKERKSVPTENKERKSVPIEKILLGTIATTGLLAVVAIAPGIGPALKMFGWGKKPYSKVYVQNAVSRLKNKGLIKFEYKEGKKYLRLTAEGKRKLSEFRDQKYTIKKPKKWDGKWRIVIFDIKETQKSIRDKLRKELLQIGFTRLQNSVWIYPYDCEEFIKMIKADHRIGKDILYVVAERVEYDKKFKHLFSL